MHGRYNACRNTENVQDEVGILKIVKAEEKDFEALYGLLCSLEDTLFDKQSLHEVYAVNLSRDDIHYVVAVDGSRVIGFASLHIQHLLHHAAKIGEIQEIMVREEKRGAGVGKLLFEALKETAIENNCTQLEICCSQARKESHGFYLKMGAKNSHYKFTLPVSEE